MSPISATAQVDTRGHLHLDVPTGLPPGEVEVVVVLQPNGTKQRDISELRGLGREIWQNVDAQEFVDGLRDEWER